MSKTSRMELTWRTTNRPRRVITVRRRIARNLLNPAHLHPLLHRNLQLLRHHRQQLARQQLARHPHRDPSRGARQHPPLHHSRIRIRGSSSRGSFRTTHSLRLTLVLGSHLRHCSIQPRAHSLRLTFLLRTTSGHGFAGQMFPTLPRSTCFQISNWAAPWCTTSSFCRCHRTGGLTRTRASTLHAQ